MKLRSHYVDISRSRASEEGAILPIIALLIVVLLVFAAFTVDLGAAWGQRTLNQSAADAGVMGGGVGFVGESPQTNVEIVAEVEKYVDLNLGYQISGDGALGGGSWATCVDLKVTAGEFYPLVDADGNVINPCVSLSADATPNGERIFRVVLPPQQTETAFARVIGIDQIQTGAFAEASLQYPTSGSGSLPFVMPANAESQFCMGDMPPGLAQDPCDGSNTGKRNDIISPWKGTTDYPGTPECSGGLYSNPLQANIALGLDHTVREAGGPDSDPEWPTTAGQDDCDAPDAGGEEPYALKLGQGGESLIEGFAGNRQFGAVQLPGRLRQGGGLNGGNLPNDLGEVSGTPLASGNAARLVDGAASNPSNMWLDNVGLWKYFAASTGATCASTSYAAYIEGGATATDALETCLASLSADAEGVFGDSILTSPRFALVPRLFLTKSALDAMPSNNFTNIQDFIPVYIQSTYWNCNAVGSPLYDEAGEPILDDDGNPELSDGTCELRFRTIEDEAAEGDDNILTNDRMWFAPGEGNSPSCLLQGALGNEKCKNNGLVSLDGVTVILLEPSWVPEEAFAGGVTSDVPLSIQMYR